MKFTIPTRYPSLNEFITSNRANRYKGSSMKKKCQQEAYIAIKQALLNLIKQSMPKVIDIEIISNKYVKCYESEDLFGNQNIYYTNDLDYWLAKLEDKT